MESGTVGLSSSYTIHMPYTWYHYPTHQLFTLCISCPSSLNKSPFFQALKKQFLKHLKRKSGIVHWFGLCCWRRQTDLDGEAKSESPTQPFKHSSLEWNGVYILYIKWWCGAFAIWYRFKDICLPYFPMGPFRPKWDVPHPIISQNMRFYKRETKLWTIPLKPSEEAKI